MLRCALHDVLFHKLCLPYLNQYLAFHRYVSPNAHLLLSNVRLLYASAL
jgi:hypothetical protein